MKAFLTGATGFVGSALAKTLAQQGHEVHALVRNRGKAGELTLPGISIFEGNILDPKSLREAMAGCDAVFHLAAQAGIWSKDPGLFERINLEGARLVFNAALEAGIRRMVFTSTGGTMGPSPAKGMPVQEDTNPNPELASAYERSKLKAEQLAVSYLGKGLEIVTVNPTRIFGPGPLEESNSVTKLIRQFSKGQWRILPGDGQSIGNYVYLDDVVAGHILALEKGRAGERYILGGGNASYSEFFELLRCLTGSDHRLIPVPVPLMMVFAQTETALARTIGKKPLIVPEFVRKLTLDWCMSSEKAVRELGYAPISLEEGVLKTLQWLQRATG